MLAKTICDIMQPYVADTSFALTRTVSAWPSSMRARHTSVDFWMMPGLCLRWCLAMAEQRGPASLHALHRHKLVGVVAGHACQAETEDFLPFHSL